MGRTLHPRTPTPTIQWRMPSDMGARIASAATRTTLAIICGGPDLTGAVPTLATDELHHPSTSVDIWSLSKVVAVLLGVPPCVCWKSVPWTVLIRSEPMDRPAGCVQNLQRGCIGPFEVSSSASNTPRSSMICSGWPKTGSLYPLSPRGSMVRISNVNAVRQKVPRCAQSRHRSRWLWQDSDNRTADLLEHRL
jgi:hypothetical protein